MSVQHIVTTMSLTLTRGETRMNASQILAAACFMSCDYTARMWHADSGKEIASSKGHEGSVHSAAFRPGGKRVVTGLKTIRCGYGMRRGPCKMRGVWERICAEGPVGEAQEFTTSEVEDPILCGVDPLSLDY